jgi:phosphatidylinositol dimannoside acyltransferase
LPAPGRDRLLVAGHRIGSQIAGAVPPALGTPLARTVGRAAARRGGARADQVRRNLARVAGAPPSTGAPTAAVGRAFASYAAYWYDLLRMPHVPGSTVDRTFAITGWEHVERAMAGGRGVVFALPHLGSWEIGARFAARRTGRPISAVVEVLRPPELFTWFAAQREAMDIHPIPAAHGAIREVLAALAAGHVVCLVADRDLSGDGIEVELFGERTTLPAGPALAAVRADVELLPVAVYARRRGRYLGVVRPPVDRSRRGTLRDDLARITQDLAHELERLVRVAPEQWHLLQPNWPSDRAVAAGEPVEQESAA